jgi:two-component system LytT family response regulator
MEIKSVIIDDEQHNIENLQTILNKWCKDITVVAVGTSVEEGIAILKTHQPELLFLDIQLHEQSGFEILKSLKTIDFEIIFITAFDQYGIQAIKFSALDYLLKPINIIELQEAIEKAKQKIASKKQNLNLENLLDYIQNNRAKSSKIALPTLQQTHYVKVEEIIRCEAFNNYTTFYLKDASPIVVCKTLKEFELLLRPYNFIRSHQSHLVNIDFVKSLQKEDGGTLLLSDNTTIPISRQNLEHVKTSLQAP